MVLLGPSHPTLASPKTGPVLRYAHRAHVMSCASSEAKEMFAEKLKHTSVGAKRTRAEQERKGRENNLIKIRYILISDYLKIYRRVGSNRFLIYHRNHTVARGRPPRQSALSHVFPSESWSLYSYHSPLLYCALLKWLAREFGLTESNN